jgi:phage-related protein
MFEQALKYIRQLDPDMQKQYLERLDSVHYAADAWRWGVGEDMDDLMAEYGFSEQ